ncbi:acyltransferase [Alteromonas halophila]|uniref:Acyltransferase n=1 Tax=Alteromonas halophila TaxID=516698 RepID=A0A918JNP8_9ALTE|nr:acyltransferase [Alteromonas halophila]GGW91833.1 acyltransferase [Alteromonas halophila]
MRALLAPFIFVIHFCLQVLNLALWGGLIIILGLVKLILPLQVLRGAMLSVMHLLMFAFGKCSVFFIRLFNPVTIDVNIDGSLSKQSWYLIVANHLSYLDIILLIEFAAGRIPAPKFFLKQELIWLPFVGLGAWALDMPFMRRYSRAYLAKHPEKKGKDLATTRAYCDKFRTTPTTVINFVEGTRFTTRKHQSKASPYQHLLPPKAGGVAFTLAAMGQLFTNVLDVSLVYPENTRHPMMAMLCGKMTRIIIDVKVLDVPDQKIVPTDADSDARHYFHDWLNQLWGSKDNHIKRLLER